MPSLSVHQGLLGVTRQPKSRSPCVGFPASSHSLREYNQPGHGPPLNSGLLCVGELYPQEYGNEPLNHALGNLSFVVGALVQIPRNCNSVAQRESFSRDLRNAPLGVWNSSSSSFIAWLSTRIENSAVSLAHLMWVFRVL